MVLILVALALVIGLSGGCGSDKAGTELTVAANGVDYSFVVVQKRNGYRIVYHTPTKVMYTMSSY